MDNEEYSMEDLFELQYEDEMDALRDMEEEQISKLDEGEQRYLKSLERSAPKSRKMLNFGGFTEEKLLTSHESSSTQNDSRTVDGKVNNSVLAKPDAQTKEMNPSTSRKRFPDDDMSVAPNTQVTSHVTKKFKVNNSTNDTEEMGTTDFVQIADDTLSTNSHNVKNRTQNSSHSSPVLPSMLKSFPQTETAKTINSRPSKSRRKIPDGDFITVRGSDGRSVYLSVLSEEQMQIKVSRFSTAQNALQLLATPMEVLKVQAEEERLAKELKKSKTLSNGSSERSLAAAMDQDTELSEFDAADNQCNLWVNRYAPRRYTELLSDEIINRGLLHWLKLWDHVVFGKENKATSATSTKFFKDKKDPANANKKPFNPSEAVDELDQLKRPLFKLALVSGPPGLGKTTLAHIIAQHAGYNVVEMNASDDRSPEAFKEKIESSTQMKAVLGADPRPNCLIIDEIDGAPQAAINVLLSVIKKSDHTNSKKKRGQAELLRRPIICICNDLYVPALRQLRQNAFLVTFYGLSSAKLSSRLLQISRIEGLKTDLTTLFALCEKADNDIRSCINTLQFVKAQAKELSQKDVQTMCLGQKDTHKTLFSTWQHVFTLPKLKRKRYINPYDRSAENVQQLDELLTDNNTSLSSRFHATLQVAMTAGEDNKIQQGLFENYLEAKVKDPRLSLIMKATDWLCYSDVINQITSESQNYSLIKYLPFVSVAFHLMFASNNPHKIIYPHSNFEFQTKLSRSENLVAAMIADVVPSVRSNLSRGVIVLELLPLLCDVIQPTLRPVNTQLYSAREKEELAQLIRVMIAYNLTYQQERNPDGQYIYKLEPNIEELVRFPDIKPLRQLTYASRQLIAREIELEKLRRSEGSNLKSQQKNAESDVPKTESRKDTASDKKVLLNHQRQRLQPKSINVEETKPSRDFFGRKIQTSAAEPKLATVKQSTANVDIWFRFKEGFSNAVRKTVRIQDLI